MKPKVSVFIATSLDGYIARNDGSIDWLIKANTLAPEGEDGGYKDFIATIDTLVMGRLSYEKVLTFGEWPYGKLPVIVLSHSKTEVPEHLQNTVSVSNQKPQELLQHLAEKGIQHVYLDGGVTIQHFLAEQLVDELTITLIPVLIGSGRSLFGTLPHDIELQLRNTRTLAGGFVQMSYSVNK